MNKNLKLLLPALLLAAFCLPAAAQDETAGGQEAPAAQEQEKPAAKPAKKASKKKAKKKKPAEPPSEYKFSAVETVPTYKFDKKANPIIKETKKKSSKKAAKGKASSSKPAAKLKPSKPIGEEEHHQGQPPSGE